MKRGEVVEIHKRYQAVLAKEGEDACAMCDACISCDLIPECWNKTKGFYYVEIPLEDTIAKNM